MTGAPDPSTTTDIIHASTVRIGDGAVVVRGASGTGKSALCLELLSRGGTLVADDRTVIAVRGGKLTAACPPQIAGLIEARGVGLLSVPHVDDVPIRLVVDLSPDPGPRLPERSEAILLGWPVKSLCSVWTSHLAPTILLLMTGAEMTE